MNNINLEDIERSIKKVNKILDIDIKNLNNSFLIDNFEKNCLLRNSNLRNQFNTICKGKQESKDINDSEVKQCNKIFLCKDGQIRDIPNILLTLFEKPKKYYIFGTPTQYSFYHSILLLLNKEYILYGKLQKERLIDESINNLVFNLDENYKKFNYKEKKFKKSVIRDNLLNSKIFLPQVINYIVDYYNISLLIIDTESYLYSLMNEYNETKDYYVILRKNNYYQPILNVEGNSKFDFSILNKINKILQAEFTIDKTIKKETIIKQEVDIKEIIDDIKKNDLKKESKYKLKELQNIADYYKIDIKINNKNKKKSELYLEIKNKIKPNSIDD